MTFAISWVFAPEGTPRIRPLEKPQDGAGREIWGVQGKRKPKFIPGKGFSCLYTDKLWHHRLLKIPVYWNYWFSADSLKVRLVGSECHFEPKMMVSDGIILPFPAPGSDQTLWNCPVPGPGVGEGPYGIAICLKYNIFFKYEFSFVFDWTEKHLLGESQSITRFKHFSLVE